MRDEAVELNLPGSGASDGDDVAGPDRPSTEHRAQSTVVRWAVQMGSLDESFELAKACSLFSDVGSFEFIHWGLQQV